MDDDALVATLQSLAHPTAVRTLRLLIAAGADGLAAGIVAERLALPRSTLFLHLAKLERSGIASSTRASKTVTYRIVPAGLRQASKALADMAAEVRT